MSEERSSRELREVFRDSGVPSSVDRRLLSVGERLLEVAHLQQRKEGLIASNRSDSSLSVSSGDVGGEVYPVFGPDSPRVRSNVLAEATTVSLPLDESVTEVVEMSLIKLDVSLNPFDVHGDQSAEDWWKHFDTVTTALCLGPDRKMEYFPIYMTGSAAAWYDGLKNKAEADSTPGNQVKVTLDEAKEGFLREFGRGPTRPGSDLACMIRRVQHPGELIRDYAHFKSVLMDAVNKKMPIAERIQWILDGLLPCYQRDLINRDFATVRDLVEAARRLETLDQRVAGCEDRVVAPVRVAVVKQEREVASGVSDMQVLMKMVLEMKEEMAGIKAGNAEGRNQDRLDSGRRFENRVICYFCNRTGHMQRDCYRYQSRNRQRDRPFDARNGRDNGNGGNDRSNVSANDRRGEQGVTSSQQSGN